jgi:hypothetical protein
MESCGRSPLPLSTPSQDLRRLSSLLCGDRDLMRDKSVAKGLNVWERRRWRSRTAVMTLTWMLIGAAGLITAIGFISVSLYFSAILPSLYTVCSLLGFLWLRRKNREGLSELDSSTSVYQEWQFFMLLILPPAVSLIVGGLTTSRFVASWTIIAPAGSIFFCQQPRILSSAVHSRWAFIQLIGRIQKSIHMYSPVMADTNVVATSAAFFAINIFLVFVDPYLVPLEIPPIRLQQVHNLLCNAECIGAINMPGFRTVCARHLVAAEPCVRACVWAYCIYI